MLVDPTAALPSMMQVSFFFLFTLKIGFYVYQHMLASKNGVKMSLLLHIKAVPHQKNNKVRHFMNLWSIYLLIVHYHLVLFFSFDFVSEVHDYELCIEFKILNLRI